MKQLAFDVQYNYCKRHRNKLIRVNAKEHQAEKHRVWEVEDILLGISAADGEKGTNENVRVCVFHAGFLYFMWTTESFTYFSQEYNQNLVTTNIFLIIPLLRTMRLIIL